MVSESVRTGGQDSSTDQGPFFGAWIPVVLTVGLSFYLVLGFQAISHQSPTFDEPLHLTAGYAYWRTGDYRLNALHHPPLASLISAVPLLFMNPTLPVDHPLWIRPRWEKAANQYGFANLFLYHNPSERSADELLSAGRSMMLAFSALFLVVLFLAAKKLFGVPAALGTFSMSALSPTLLGHGSLVTTDFLFAAFYFFFFWCLGRWEETKKSAAGSPSASFKWAAGTGLSLAFCFCSKFSAVAVGPVLLVWAFWRKFRFGLGLKQLAISMLTSLVAILIVYRFDQLPIFFSGLRYTMERIQSGRATFLWGQYSLEGWWYYFPIVFLLKTPPALLAFSVAGVYGLFRERIRWPWYLVLPPAGYFLMACASSVQIGHRHILPVYPFLFFAAGWGLARMCRGSLGKVLATALGVFAAADVFMSAPFLISYVTPLAGGPSHGYQYMTDSNVDWGQGMKALKKYLEREGIGSVYLSYFGTSEPAAYGIRQAPVVPYTLPEFSTDKVELKREPRALLVISATNFQCTYFADKNLFKWLKNRSPVTTVAGGSLLVFDITHDEESHRRLAALFARTGNDGLAAYETQWADELNASSRAPGAPPL